MIPVQASSNNLNRVDNFYKLVWSKEPGTRGDNTGVMPVASCQLGGLLEGLGSQLEEGQLCNFLKQRDRDSLWPQSPLHLENMKNTGPASSSQ